MDFHFRKLFFACHASEAVLSGFSVSAEKLIVRCDLVQYDSLLFKL